MAELHRLTLIVAGLDNSSICTTFKLQRQRLTKSEGHGDG